MEHEGVCQSCGMPLDSEEVKGIEKSGQKSNEYCKYCYENGDFIHPKMNLENMKSNVENQMKKLALPKYSITKSINILPVLKRWKNK